MRRRYIPSNIANSSRNQIVNHLELPYAMVKAVERGNIMETPSPRVYISYSWDNNQHKAWVRSLAIRLREDGIEALLDQFEIVPGDHIPTFIEKIPDCDFVLIICTPNYKLKSEKRKGGVGYESNIISSELFARQNHRQYIPVLRLGDNESAIPLMISGKAWIDLRDDPLNETEYRTLLRTLKGERPMAPPVGRKATSAGNISTQSALQQAGTEWEDIKINGVDLEGVTSPRNDGMPGSALYEIPFFLSCHPPDKWSEIFEDIWQHPPRYTTMHRPNIAHISGDRLVLDGTTMEEIRDYHQHTLRLVVKETNDRYREYLRKKNQMEARKELLADEHKRNIEDIADELDFDKG